MCVASWQTDSCSHRAGQQDDRKYGVRIPPSMGEAGHTDMLVSSSSIACTSLPRVAFSLLQSWGVGAAPTSAIVCWAMGCHRCRRSVGCLCAPA